MHHLDIYLDNGQILTKNQNSLGIEHKKLRISTENGRNRGKEGGGKGSQIEKVRNFEKSKVIDHID